MFDINDSGVYLHINITSFSSIPYHGNSEVVLKFNWEQNAQSRAKNAHVLYFGHCPTF